MAYRIYSEDGGNPMEPVHTTRSYEDAIEWASKYFRKHGMDSHMTLTLYGDRPGTFTMYPSPASPMGVQVIEST